MRLRNVGFDLVSFMGAMLWLWCAVFSIVDYVRHGRASLVVTVSMVGLFLLLALIFFRHSLLFGDYQKRVREVGTEPTLAARKVGSADQAAPDE